MAVSGAAVELSSSRWASGFPACILQPVCPPFRGSFWYLRLWHCYCLEETRKSSEHEYPLECLLMYPGSAWEDLLYTRNFGRLWECTGGKAGLACRLLIRALSYQHYKLYFQSSEQGGKKGPHCHRDLKPLTHRQLMIAPYNKWYIQGI